MRSHISRFLIRSGGIISMVLLLAAPLLWGQVTTWARLVGSVTDHPGRWFLG